MSSHSTGEIKAAGLSEKDGPAASFVFMKSDIILQKTDFMI